MDYLLIVALVLGAVWLLVLLMAVPVLLIWAIRRQSAPRRPYSRRRERLPMATPAQMRAAVREISTYTHNEDTAARLLHHTRLENRDKPLSWCVEKTIHDLVRDRR